MKVVDCCTPIPAIVASDDTLLEAARLMRDNHVGSLGVGDRHDIRRPVGMITDRDVVVAAVAEGRDCQRARVGEVMQRGATCIAASDGVREAISLMRTRGVRRLPVVDDDGTLLGIVSSDDLAAIVAAELQGLAIMSRQERERERLLRGDEGACLNLPNGG